MESQEKIEDNFTLYIQNNRYNKQIVNLALSNNQIDFYHYLGNYYIDRKKENIINLINVEEALNKLFPDRNTSAFLCLNIENEVYKGVRDNSKGSKKFIYNNLELIKLIQFVKKKRPNIKVGIYGIPFNYYWSIQKLRNTEKKYVALLREVDFISPHLYIHYPNHQVGKTANFEYLNKNIEQALEYGKRLNKSVIPYVWYLVHPANKKYGAEYIDVNTMKEYLNHIRKFQLEGRKVNGVIWWEPAKLNYKIYESTKIPSCNKILSIDNILLQNLNFLNE
jgi:hypothetical protein